CPVAEVVEVEIAASLGGEHKGALPTRFPDVRSLRARSSAAAPLGDSTLASRRQRACRADPSDAWPRGNAAGAAGAAGSVAGAAAEPGVGAGVVTPRRASRYHPYPEGV